MFYGGYICRVWVMIYRVVFNQRSAKDFKKYLHQCAPKQRRQAHAIVESLRADPRRGIGHKHPLEGRLRGYWACRLDGSTRLLYTINDDEILVYVDRFSSDHYRDVHK